MEYIIEPCCAERQLPALLREQKGRAVMFQTYGDVTFEIMLKSVASMAGNDHLTVTLAVEDVTDRIGRTLRRYEEREWITTLRLIEGDMVGEAICIEGTLGTVVIQGPLDCGQRKGTPVLYAGQFCPVKGDSRHPLVKLLEARWRRAAAETAGNATATVSAGDAEATVSEPRKRKSNRKTKKQ